MSNAASAATSGRSSSDRGRVLLTDCWRFSLNTLGDMLASPAEMASGKQVLYTPWFWRWILLIIRHIPERIFVRLKL